MKKTELYVGLGSSNLVISVVGSGIVLREPCLVAVDIDTQKIIEWGTKAKKMLGKVSAGIDIFSPIEKGVVKHPNYATKLLELALNKVFANNIPNKICVNFIVKIGIEDNELQVLKQIANENNIGEVYFKFKPLLALSGAGVNTSNSNAYLSVCFGGGVTNIAIVSQNKILAGCSISLGGNNLDEAICEYLVNKYNLEVSCVIAEKIKTYCGSLIMQDTSNMEVVGIDSVTKAPKKEFVCANDVRASVTHFFDYIADIIQKLLNTCTPDVVAEVLKNGIYLSGGSANLGGVQEYLYNLTNLVVHVVENPENCAYLV